MMQSIHWRDYDNTGDMASVPFQYFEFNQEIKYLHINKLEKFDPNVPFILGGGGIIYADKTKIISKTKAIKIAWGIGVNNPYKKEDSIPDYLKNFNLVGIRDWNLGCDWVPCASCMSNLFDENWKTKHEVIAYLHGEIKNIENIPHKKCTEGLSLKQAIEFLSSGEIIITSSYHGMYWGVLLGKKVIVVPHQNSSRFNYFKYPLPIVSDWTKIKKIPTYPQALEESRLANTIFYKKARKLLLKIL